MNYIDKSIAVANLQRMYITFEIIYTHNIAKSNPKLPYKASKTSRAYSNKLLTKNSEQIVGIFLL